MKPIHSEANMHELEAQIDYLETKVERLEEQLEYWKHKYQALINDFPNEEHF